MNDEIKHRVYYYDVHRRRECFTDVDSLEEARSVLEYMQTLGQLEALGIQNIRVLRLTTTYELVDLKSGETTCDT